ncbi:HlyD family secretion protein [Sphingomonas sp. SORGH_AS802]|uniref:efflux RND transporter periplasmic adaptor subunit n=1 Tax=unclassified Sphingomonas TaxID=196159 RepID=UPI0028628C3E|nr:MULTISPECIES: efflux RND transporter periplasmic adaptor subunit [unclassified Sphingomonas]MDR6128753.1 HlyD family secretion protein [Sphingomonas sp. SORGH_AS_0438]MDR6136233.1 HlyD family secretion protein [Sphingomonas sp. SORGH_AS_0802]
MVDTPSSLSGVAMDRRIERPGRRRRQRILRAAAAIGAIGGGAALWWLMPASGSLTVDAQSLQVGAVTNQAFRDFVPLRAEVAPLHTVFVTAVSGGSVTELIATDGAMVTTGAPLARLSNPSLELEVASRAAGIIGQLSSNSGARLSIQRSRQDAQRDIAEARNALAKAQTVLRQKALLYEKGFVTKAAIDPLQQEVTYQQDRVAALTGGQARTQATLADQTAGINATERELRDSLAMVRASLGALTIRAPVAGRLTAFTMQPGQMLKTGDPVGQIDSEGQWKLVADIDQYYLSRVRPGLAARADVDGTGYPLRVLKILPQVTDGRFRVEFTFDGAAPPLHRGQTLDVRLVLGADRPAIVAPAGGWLDAGGATAFVMDGSGRAVRRAVQTGRRNPEQVEVTAGLSPGEHIVTSPLVTYAPYKTLIIR